VVEQDSSWRPDYTRLLQTDPELADSVVMCKLMPGDHMLWDDRCIVRTMHYYALTCHG
jgi:hypothetical protein